ncbi:integrase [Gossypium australe]|uniref:Integrase n=1 Tax=Gossypium australe TaxID=47621 RepID=A0A5B6VVF6_9ROSI|nr:integrase [Gossypium australe]
MIWLSIITQEKLIRLCVLKNSKVKQEILREAHSSNYSIHPTSCEMYSDLKQMYWWLDMKHDILEFLLIFKAKHQVLSGLLQPVMIPE